MPPYRFDITPFLGLLNDGKPHEIAAKVYGQGEAGTWFLDMVLVGSHGCRLKVVPAPRRKDGSAAPAPGGLALGGEPSLMSLHPGRVAEAASQPQEAPCRPAHGA